MKESKKPAACLAAMIVLLAMAVYQIILIFWEIPHGHMTESSYQEVQPDEEANMMEPAELYITLGGNEGSYARLTRREDGFSDVFLQAYALMRRIMLTGEITEAAQLPWEKEACILSFDFTMEGLIAAEQMELPKDRLPEILWDEIWVLPAKSREEQSQVYLLDSEAGSYICFQYKGWNWEENQLLLDELMRQAAQLKKHYFSSEAAWPGRQLKSDYVLEQTQREKIRAITAYPGFTREKALDPNVVSSHVMRLFEYPDTVTVKAEDTRIVFSNEKITVKADESGRLQYVETLTEAEKEPLAMREAYQLAVGFVKEELRWSDDSESGFIFSDYEVQENGYVFYFNYVIDGIPYRMEAAKIAQWRLAYPIKVTVEGSKVRRYERYVLNFEVEPESEQALNSTWQDAMNALAKKGWTLREVPKLTYYFIGGKLTLQWEAEILDGRTWMKAD